jgi:chromosomal replication initiator protein
MQIAPTLGRFLVVPENRAAFLAIEAIGAAFQTNLAHRLVTPLMLHGPGGAGKTHLATALIHELMRQNVQLGVRQMVANDWKMLLMQRPSNTPEGASRSGDSTRDPSETPTWLAEARAADFLVVEDLHHLPSGAAEAMVQLLDERQGHHLPTLGTSRFGPRQLAQRSPRLGERLTSRLAAGLVVALAPLQADSRLRLLQEFAQRRQLAVGLDILRWLATHLAGGGRQLEGVVAQLDTLAKLQRRPLQLADIRPHFRAQMEALQPSVERIVEQVGGHFGIEPADLYSRRRLRSILLPRQISMYLARRLTGLSMKQIGARLGGHDHSTVLHACRKIEDASRRDALLSGAIRQLQGELM